MEVRKARKGEKCIWAIWRRDNQFDLCGRPAAVYWDGGYCRRHVPALCRFIREQANRDIAGGKRKRRVARAIERILRESKPKKKASRQ